MPTPPTTLYLPMGLLKETASRPRLPRCENSKERDDAWEQFRRTPEALLPRDWVPGEYAFQVHPPRGYPTAGLIALAVVPLSAASAADVEVVTIDDQGTPSHPQHTCERLPFKHNIDLLISSDDDAIFRELIHSEELARTVLSVVKSLGGDEKGDTEYGIHQAKESALRQRSKWAQESLAAWAKRSQKALAEGSSAAVAPPSWFGFAELLAVGEVRRWLTGHGTPISTPVGAPREPRKRLDKSLAELGCAGGTLEERMRGLLE